MVLKRLFKRIVKAFKTVEEVKTDDPREYGVDMSHLLRGEKDEYAPWRELQGSDQRQDIFDIRNVIGKKRGEK